MPCNAAGSVAVTDAIREDNTGNIVTAGKYRAKITPLVSTGRDGNHFAFQSGKL